jgi:hypothetical protein
MANVVSHQPLTAKAQVKFQARPNGISAGQRGTQDGLPRVLGFQPSVFTVPPIPHDYLLITNAT